MAKLRESTNSISVFSLAERNLPAGIVVRRHSHHKRSLTLFNASKKTSIAVLWSADYKTQNCGFWIFLGSQFRQFLPSCVTRQWKIQTLLRHPRCMRAPKEERSRWPIINDQIPCWEKKQNVPWGKMKVATKISRAFDDQTRILVVGWATQKCRIPKKRFAFMTCDLASLSRGEEKFSFQKFEHAPFSGLLPQFSGDRKLGTQKKSFHTRFFFVRPPYF